jgi:hypothetical protein
LPPVTRSVDLSNCQSVKHSAALLRKCIPLRAAEIARIAAPLGPTAGTHQNVEFRLVAADRSAVAATPQIATLLLGELSGSHSSRKLVLAHTPRQAPTG